MREDFDLLIPHMNYSWEMNKERYFWPICAFNVTCVIYSQYSLVECCWK